MYCDAAGYPYSLAPWKPSLAVYILPSSSKCRKPSVLFYIRVWSQVFPSSWRHTHGYILRTYMSEILCYFSFFLSFVLFLLLSFSSSPIFPSFVLTFFAQSMQAVSTFSSPSVQLGFYECIVRVVYREKAGLMQQLRKKKKKKYNLLLPSSFDHRPLSSSLTLLAVSRDQAGSRELD